MDESGQRPGGRGTQLRIAMGMRGGVSLAVWMGGACSEVDRLRHALDGDAPPDEVYRRLLEAGGHTSVAVDVLAGASAGGLNSVLMSCSVVHGMRFDSRIRDLWLRLGDLGSLLRRDGGGQPASLLDGDRAFYGALARELRTLVPEVRPDVRPPRLDTILTCTLFAGAPRARYPDLGPPIVERRNRAWFRFRSRPAEGGEAPSDFGSTTDDLPGALDRLAYAARATSSFPGAFEPASIGFARDSRAPDGDSSVALPPTHYGVYSESRPQSDGEIDAGIDRDHVIDGGVLDNIPLAWAVRAIAAAPADCPVDRWLLYLQPIPFAPPPRADRERPRTFDTVRRARQLKGGTEALADDLDELERLRRDGERRRGFAQVLEYALGQVPEGTTKPAFLEDLCERALAGRKTYRERAGAMEAGRIRELWTDPLAVLGADPLSFADTTRDPLPPSAAALLALLPAAGPELVLPPSPSAGDGVPSGPEAVRELADLALHFRSPQVLARTVSVLLDAARALEDDGLALKSELYRVRQDIELLVAHADRALAAAPRTLDEIPSTAGGLVEVIRSAVPAGAPDDDGWPSHADLWKRLVDKAQDLAEVAAKQAAASDREESRAFLGCLVKAADETPDQARATRAVLAAVELLTGPLRPDPLAETTPVRFHMISALNRSPLIPARSADGLRPSADKLAGNQLSNFGAFLSARWRLNDWTWGRLDAAASLVDVLLQSVGADGTALTGLREYLQLPATAALSDVRDECVRRLHDTVLREELPLLATVRDQPPPAGAPAVPALPPGAELDTSALQRIGDEKVRDLTMRSGGRLGDVARLAGVAGLVLADGLAQRAGRQGADLGRWFRRRTSARMKAVVDGMKAG